MTTFSFDHVLGESGWLEPATMTVDELGFISELRTGRAAEAFPISGFVIPGLPNLHSHAFQRALAGLTEHAAAGVADSFWTWREKMYALAGALTPDDLESIASLLY